MRTLGATLALSVGLIAWGCNKNVEQGAEMESSEAPASLPQRPPPVRGSTERPSQGDALEGTIHLASELADRVTGREVLFLIARQPTGGPPLAVQRISAPQFPLRFRLTQQDVMMEGLELAGKVLLSARLDRDGIAGPAATGDLEGRTPEPVLVGGGPVRLVIDEPVP